MRENLAEIGARGTIPRRRGRSPMMREFSARKREAERDGQPRARKGEKESERYVVIAKL